MTENATFSHPWHGKFIGPTIIRRSQIQSKVIDPAHPESLFNLRERKQKRLAQCSEPHPLPSKTAVPLITCERKRSFVLPRSIVYPPAIPWSRLFLPTQPLSLVTVGVLSCSMLSPDLELPGRLGLQSSHTQTKSQLSGGSCAVFPLGIALISSISLQKSIQQSSHGCHRPGCFDWDSMTATPNQTSPRAVSRFSWAQ